jgi:ABC-2 type transport system ATP-binding protein
MLLSNADNIYINGQSLQKNIPEIFRSMGTLIETPSLYLHLTAKENLRIITTMRGLAGGRIKEVLDIVGLGNVGDKKIKEYSLGMKQRLGIAMALLPDPELLILDEPANGLDPSGIIHIRELLKRLNTDLGKTIFISSHLLSEIEKTCTHIGIIHKGVLRYQGSLQEMKAAAYASGEVIFKITGTNEWLPALQQEFPQVKQVSHDEILFSFSNQEEVARINQQLVNKQIPVCGIQVKGGLEDWFMRITQTDKEIV